jgi:predicted S18 family serine protease
MRKILLFVALCMLCVLPLASARSGSIALLAVSEAGEEEVGSVANLYLEIEEGTGRVFIDSFPLTKLDTQISTRFANEIACSFAETDCSNYDFFYTIRANSAIVGGPSASAAITVLTISVLDGTPLDGRSTITGTINSGGVIGPVGGIVPKVRAAARSNLTKVLVPRWTSANDTDLENVSDEFGIDVVKVSNLDDAVFEMTGRRYRSNKSLIINSFYLDTMRNISETLCGESEVIYIDLNNTLTRDAINLTERGSRSILTNEFYSAASFCFGANVKFRYARFLDGNLGRDEILQKIDEISQRTKDYREHISGIDIDTITDLQTYMIVNQRLMETEDQLSDARASLLENSTNASIYSLAFGIERLNSAYSWSNFFGKGGTEYVIDRESLADSCLKKISEVEERIQYLQLFIDSAILNKQDDLKRAYDDHNKGDYDLCLFRASITKAEIDTVLNSIGISEDQVDDVIDERLGLVESLLADQDQEGVFPILGYSYFEYAKSLQDTDRYSTLLYLEYAIELSNFDIYFEKDRAEMPRIDFRYIGLFAGGFLLGFLICYLWLRKEFIGSGKRRRIR